MARKSDDEVGRIRDLEARDFLDPTYQILSELEELKQEIKKDPLDCIGEHGQQHGEAAGRAAMEAQFNGEAIPAADPMKAYLETYQTCAPEGIQQYYQDREPLPIPDTLNPYVAGLEVALTPTGANVGEDQALAAPHTYADSFAEGYRDGQAQVFDEHLEQRFEKPETLPVHEHHNPAPIDTPAGGLDYTPEPVSYSEPSSSSSDTSSHSSGSSGDTNGIY